MTKPARNGFSPCTVVVVQSLGVFLTEVVDTVCNVSSFLNPAPRVLSELFQGRQGLHIDCLLHPVGAALRMYVPGIEKTLIIEITRVLMRSGGRCCASSARSNVGMPSARLIRTEGMRTRQQTRLRRVGVVSHVLLTFVIISNITKYLWM